MGRQLPDLTLTEWTDRLHEQLGIEASTPTICRVLQQLRLPHKKAMHTTRWTPNGYNKLA